MVTDGDEVLRQHLQTSPAAAREWAETRKLKNDPRVTPVGAALRRLSLDELPQLINVLRGDMSIVGPRPIVTDEVAMYGADARYYFMARPGLTGPWQIGGRNDETYEDRVALDRAYVENWSSWKDIDIMIKTVPAVLNLRGSY
jgi:exopolysaccharide production protein ExoY